MQDSTTTASLRGIASPGNGVAWASGTDGTVLRTEDGGFVWQGCAMPPGAEKLDFRGVQAFDAQTALVMSSGKGDLSRVYKTTDGCRTWTLVFKNPDAEGFFDAIAMNPPGEHALHDYGVIAGDPVGGVFSLFLTFDRGSTWQRMPGRPAARSGEALFAASNQALVFAKGVNSLAMATGGTAGSRLLTLELCGGDYAPDYIPEGCQERFADKPQQKDGQLLTPYLREWESEDLGFNARASAGAFAVGVKVEPSAFGRISLVIGGDYAHPDDATTNAEITGLSAGKVSWQQAKNPPHGYRSSVAYDAASKTWITVGPNGTDISRDDGRNWSPLLPGKGDAADADKQWNALALPFVVGPHGRIGRLREGVLKPSGAVAKSIH